jgi:hypothetical protein
METIDLGNGTFCKMDDSGNKYWFKIDDSMMWRCTGEHYAIQGFANEMFYVMPANEVLHRTDGPAIERANYHKSWYINGKQYSEEDWEQVKEVLWAI